MRSTIARGLSSPSALRSAAASTEIPDTPLRRWIAPPAARYAMRSRRNGGDQPASSVQRRVGLGVDESRGAPPLGGFRQWRQEIDERSAWSG
jgi:hypothetical protein